MPCWLATRATAAGLRWCALSWTPVYIVPHPIHLTGTQREVLERIADAGLSPDSITYATLLNAYARSGLLDELEQVCCAFLA